MSEMHDAESLLAEFKRTRSETAFRALVERFRGLVFSTALRQLSGDSHLAEDVVQKVFADLAQKASQLRPDGGFGGWLHCHTCFVSANLRKSEQRRRTREQVAASTAPESADNHAIWMDAEAELDAAINELNEADRGVIIARFFEKQPLKVIGDMFAVSDRAAHMRISRAVDRLREQLGKRGIAIPVAALATGLTESANAAVPKLAVKQIVTHALSGGTSGAVLMWFSKIPMTAKLTLVVVLGVVALMRNSPETVTHALSVVQSPGAVRKDGDSMTTAAIGQPRAQTDTGSRNVTATPQTTGSTKCVVRFVDRETGEPLPYFNYRRGFSFENRMGGTGEAKADENGEAVMEIAEDCTSYMVKSYMDGWAVVEVNWDVRKGDMMPERFKFEVPRGVAVGGWVLDPEGNPVANASIILGSRGFTDEERINKRYEPSFLHHSPRSDSNGWWQATTVAAEYLADSRIRAEHEDWLNSKSARLFDNSVRSNALNKTLILTMVKGLTISGRVVDESGKPLHADVSSAKSWRGRCKTREDGTFELHPVEHGPSYIEVRSRDFANRRLKIDFTNDPPPVVIALNRGRDVTVEVTDSDGNPVPGIKVSYSGSPFIRPESVPLWSDLPTATFARGYGNSDINGLVSFRTVPKTPVLVSARPPDYGYASVLLDSNVNSGVIRFKLRDHITGSVTDALTGEPLERFAMQMRTVRNKGEFPENWERGTAFYAGRFDYAYAVPKSRKYIRGGKHYPDARMYCRIEAPGYAAQVSEPIVPYSGSQHLNIKLVQTVGND